MSIRPGSPAVTQGITLFPRDAGDTTNGVDQGCAPFVETATFTTPGPFSAVESKPGRGPASVLVGYSDHTAYRLPLVSIAIVAKRFPVKYAPAFLGNES